MQAVLTTFILCVDLLLSAKYLPYTLKSLNILEVVCTMSAIVVMNCGLLIHTQQFNSTIQRDAMAAFILILIFACISITVGIFLVEMKIKIQTQLMKGITGEKNFDESFWASKQIGVDTAPAKLQKTSYLRDAFAHIGGRSNSAILSPPVDHSGGVSRAPSTKRQLDMSGSSGRGNI
ncbi:hypothetical protein BKA69DRAFT_229815 [Paraphysoderma sedebokerense]|nr:hypothetical protein BKA69DRAFT_229815 [Paraphysoderma sedebokerense]